MGTTNKRMNSAFEPWLGIWSRNGKGRCERIIHYSLTDQVLDQVELLRFKLRPKFGNLEYTMLIVRDNFYPWDNYQNRHRGNTLFFRAVHLHFEPAIIAQNQRIQGSFDGSFSRLLKCQDLAKKLSQYLASIITDKLVQCICRATNVDQRSDVKYVFPRCLQNPTLTTCEYYSVHNITSLLRAKQKARYLRFYPVICVFDLLIPLRHLEHREHKKTTHDDHTRKCVVCNQVKRELGRLLALHALLTNPPNTQKNLATCGAASLPGKLAEGAGKLELLECPISFDRILALPLPWLDFFPDWSRGRLPPLDWRLHAGQTNGRHASVASVIYRTRSQITHL